MNARGAPPECPSNTPGAPEERPERAIAPVSPDPNRFAFRFRNLLPGQAAFSR
ncbi:hypothetical protein SAMN05444272_3136 [Roseibium suaedae]|uniref:Uncharacterized protein n=1 Tax=Roseibium suaedae TaxID=735517 RepID=A0A1M7LAC1_9HYPH|nr:hypothetical protein SAMN05444272_3136 [Roseibium suaedae]